MIRISAFSDEVSPVVEEQIAYLRRAGVKWMEVRFVDGCNITTLSEEEARALRRRLDEAGIGVSAVASPIGKYPVDAPFGPHLELFRHTVRLAGILGTRLIRVFSFYGPEGGCIDDCRDAVVERLGRLAAELEGTDIRMAHENEARIFGHSAANCVALAEGVASDRMTLAYDPAAPDLTKTGEAAKITASGASVGENYEITYVDGKLTVTSRPSSGGGGSSSSGGGGGSSSSDKPSASTGKTETTTNPDGSVTKTEIKSDGTVTETTTNKDGSTTKTETKPDGSSKTEVKDASGSTGTVKTDKNGHATAETTLSSKAVDDAKKNGGAVKAPVEVEASRDSNTAPTVKVELPKNAGETAVEIPVSNVKPGTVAVLVQPDGTEEIVKNSLPTEDSIRLTMDGSATVKIMDNSKDFIDTRAHWAKDAIDFVSARGLVNGISDTIYAPNNSTTRAQLWTILARQNDADLTGGSIWYEKAQNWAKDKGVSDGANPNAAINRAQMVTMLWRAMGQPAAASGASFADVPADSYYAQAVAWAIENGITAGVGNGKFDPDAACTRGQIATFLYRYMK